MTPIPEVTPLLLLPDGILITTPEIEDLTFTDLAVLPRPGAITAVEPTQLPKNSRNNHRNKIKGSRGARFWAEDCSDIYSVLEPTDTTDMPIAMDGEAVGVAVGVMDGAVTTIITRGVLGGVVEIEAEDGDPMVASPSVVVVVVVEEEVGQIVPPADREQLLVSVAPPGDRSDESYAMQYSVGRYLWNSKLSSHCSRILKKNTF